MQVRLTSISQPTPDLLAQGVDTPEKLLAYYARVSSVKNQDNHATGPKLIRSLISRAEWSPLEMVSATFEIYTTRNIGRQILRHRSFSFQEFSQRYAEVEDQPEYSELRTQHATDRQSSNEVRDDQHFQDSWLTAQKQVWDHAMEVYRTALANGVAKEVARVLLPEGMSPTKMYMAGTLRSWYHYVDLRSTEGTQKEHRVIALECGRLLIEKFPSMQFADRVHLYAESYPDNNFTPNPFTTWAK